MSERYTHFDRSEFYSDYSALKQWVRTEAVDHVDRFSKTMRRLPLAPRSVILEIGFGEGRFLDWAGQRGHTIEGIEILPEMAEAARSRGHVVHLGDLSQLENNPGRFDFLMAFDVVEHLSIPEILQLLKTADRLLKKDGKIVLQFPNAASPFSTYYQSGDVTHQTALSKEALDQISRRTGWTVNQAFNARASSSHPLKQLKMSIAHVLRDCIEVLFGFIYYGVRRPIDPNIIVILARRKTDLHIDS